MMFLNINLRTEEYDAINSHLDSPLSYNEIRNILQGKNKNEKVIALAKKIANKKRRYIKSINK